MSYNVVNLGYDNKFWFSLKKLELFFVGPATVIGKFNVFAASIA